MLILLLPKRAVPLGYSSCCKSELFSLGSLYRAGSCTGTAADASISIDLCLTVTHSDSTNRASVNAGAAADALFTDRICHNTNLLIITSFYIQEPFVPTYIITYFQKNAIPFQIFFI